MENPRLQQVLQLLEKEPGDAFLSHALAMEYLSMGERSKAIEVMEKLLSEHPDYTGTYYHLGHAWLASGQRERAMATWEKGIEKSRLLKKQHHLSELQAAINQLLFDEED